MSHFVTAVFSQTSDDVSDMLEPFNECVDAESPYSEFEQDDGCDYDENAGAKGYWVNRNAHWDWWEPGGRWAKYLKLKKGRQGTVLSAHEKSSIPIPASDGFCDQTLAANCDFGIDKESYDKAIRFWEIVVEGQPEHEDEVILNQNGKYYEERYENKEAYAQEQARRIPFAFVAADGSWHEMGRMGWFGNDDSTAESRKAYIAEWEAELQKAIEQGLLITIVDCHI